MFRIFVDDNNDPSRDFQKENELVINVLNSITDGFFLVDNDWKVLFWNNAAEQILKAPKNLVLGNNLWDAYDDAREMEFYGQYHKAKSENVTVEFIGNYTSLNLWVDVRAYPFEQGLAVYFKDITARREMQREIEYTKSQQSALINATADSIWSIDANFNLLIGNRSFFENWHFATGKELRPGDNILKDFPDDVMKRQENNYKRALAGETLRVIDSLENPVTKQPIIIEVSLNPIYDSDGLNIIGAACYSRDITQQQLDQLLLEEKTRQLEENQQNLKELNRKLENVLDSSLDLIGSFDEMGRFVHVNKASKNLLGFEPSELIGKSFWELVEPDDLENSRLIFKEIKNGLEVTNFNNRFVCSNGESVYLDWSSRWDEKSKLFYSVARDVTELMKSEAIRKKTEARLAAIVEKGADMVCIVNDIGNYIYVSPNTRQILGYLPTLLLGTNAFEQIHPKDQDFLQRLLTDIVLGADVKKAEFRFLHADGSYRWIEIAASNHFGDPAIKGIIINSRDISERKLQEQEFHAINERYQTILDITNEGIWEWDFESDNVYYNRNFNRFFGIEGGNAGTIQSWLDFIHKDDVDRVKTSIYKTIESASDQVWHEKYRFFKANGEMTYIADSGILIKNSDGKPVKMVGSMQDVTLERTIEKEREKIIEELTRNNEDLRQFSFITSHNLRSPLSNILGFLDIIDVNRLEDSQRQLFELIRTSSVQLQETINDLTDIIVIRNRLDYPVKSVQFKEIFTHIQNIYLNTLHDIPVTVSTHFELEQAHLHKPYLESILYNLVSNSVKYRHKERPLEIEIRTKISPDGRGQLVFQDNGSGMEMEKVQSKIFSMYQQFHPKTEGKGLGLFMIKSQIMAMGGTISVTSEPGKGTVFTLEFPLK